MRRSTAAGAVHSSNIAALRQVHLVQLLSLVAHIALTAKTHREPQIKKLYLAITRFNYGFTLVPFAVGFRRSILLAKSKN